MMRFVFCRADTLTACWLLLSVASYFLMIRVRRTSVGKLTGTGGFQLLSDFFHILMPSCLTAEW